MRKVNIKEATEIASECSALGSPCPTCDSLLDEHSVCCAFCIWYSFCSDTSLNFCSKLKQESRSTDADPT